MKRHGNWFVTFTSKRFYPLDARPEDVCIEDIAHALSLICRYGGHCREFYSVAQHSCYVADLIEHWHSHDYAIQLYALLHDATEAYLGDMVRPLKLSMPDYVAAEVFVEKAIFRALDLPTLSHPMFEAIKRADNMVLMAERRDIVNHDNHPWNIKEPPWDSRIAPVSSIAAERMFLACYARLVDKLAPVAA